MRSPFDGYTGNVRTHDGQGRIELLDRQRFETCCLKGSTRRTIRVASVPHSRPERPDGSLDAPQQRATRGSHMFNENESSAGLEHTNDFSNCPPLIHHAAQHQCADDEIGGTCFERQLFGCSRTQINIDSETSGFSAKMVVHVRVGFHADPANVLRRQVAQVRPSARADLQHGARDPGEQSGLMRCEIVVSVVPESGHEPGKEPQANGPRSAAKIGTRGFLLESCVHQYQDYSAFGVRPP